MMHASVFCSSALKFLTIYLISSTKGDLLTTISSENGLLSSVIPSLEETVSSLKDTLSTVIIPQDATLNTVELATKYGHPPKQHQVITEDGYILTIYQLPGRRATIPILLMHGLFDSSDTWLLRGNESLAITLANKGFEVWLGNNRGNRYAREHKLLNPDTDAAFWQFSFHEMGVYDLPTTIDTILKETGATNLTIFGHSQGNVQCYALVSERPEYNSKINLLVGLGPIAFLHNAPAPAAVLIRLSPVLNLLSNILGITEVVGDNTTLGKTLHALCPTPIAGYATCANLLFTLVGFDVTELEPDFYPIPGARYPAGASARSILHFLQVGFRRNFVKYDFGNEGNLRVYNSSESPPYRLDRVTAPVALFVGRNDRLSAIPDVEILRDRLPNVVDYQIIPRRLMNHYDFVWGRTMRDYLFPSIYRVLQSNNYQVTNTAAEST